MASGERNGHFATVGAAVIVAIGGVTAALIGRSGGGAAGPVVAVAPPTPDQAKRLASAASIRPKAVPGGDSPSLPSDWIDARGRYYALKQSGERFGVIAYNGGQLALDKDRVRLTGDGTLTGSAIRWTWQPDRSKKVETCAGSASPAAIAVSCDRDGRGGYDLRLVVR